MVGKHTSVGIRQTVQILALPPESQSRESHLTSLSRSFSLAVKRRG